MGVYGSPMDWFNIGTQTGPAAGIGGAIRGILDLHTKLAETAGAQMIKSASPLEQAHTKYYNSAADNPFMQMVNSGASGDAVTNIMDKYETGLNSKGKPVLVKKAVPSDTDEKRTAFNQLIEAVNNGQIDETKATEMWNTKYPEVSLESGSGFGNEWQKSAIPPVTVSPWSRLNPGSKYRDMPIGAKVNARTGKVLDNFQAPQTAPVAPQQVSQQAQQVFNTPQEADSSGLPAGSIVMVGGRRYQI